MMDEMQKTLARRRAKVDRSSEEPDSDKQDGGAERTEKSASPGKPYSGHSSQAGSESPKPGRRRHSTRGSICGDKEVRGEVTAEAESLMSSSVGCLASG